MYDLHTSANITESETIDKFVPLVEYLGSFRLSSVIFPSVDRNER